MKEGKLGTWSHCGNPRLHPQHYHTVYLNEGPYPSVLCLGTLDGDHALVIQERREKAVDDMMKQFTKAEVPGFRNGRPQRQERVTYEGQIGITQGNRIPAQKISRDKIEEAEPVKATPKKQMPAWLFAALVALGGAGFLVLYTFLGITFTYFFPIATAVLALVVIYMLAYTSIKEKRNKT